eukprot:3336471-Rhodomonas_salina.2
MMDDAGVEEEALSCAVLCSQGTGLGRSTLSGWLSRTCLTSSTATSCSLRRSVRFIHARSQTPNRTNTNTSTHTHTHENTHTRSRPTHNPHDIILPCAPTQAPPSTLRSFRSHSAFSRAAVIRYICETRADWLLGEGRAERARQVRGAGASADAGAKGGVRFKRILTHTALRMCVCVCVCVRVFFRVSVSVLLTLACAGLTAAPVPLTHCCTGATVRAYVFVFVCVCSCVRVRVSVCLCLCLFLSLCLCVSVSVSVSVSVLLTPARAGLTAAPVPLRQHKPALPLL